MKQFVGTQHLVPLLFYESRKIMKRIIPVLVILSLMACAAPSTPTLANSTSTSSPVPTAAPTGTPAATATSTPLEISSIPGFEDWSVNNPPAVEIQAEDGALLLILRRRVLWFMDRQGVLAYTPVEGDFKITADLYTMKRSDPSQAPGGDRTVQLGGLMARDGVSAQENYVFIVVGDDGNGLSVETKNTTNDVSEYDGPFWDSPNASLRLCRAGQTFHLYKRHIDNNEPWLLAASFERPDLPESLQVGVNIYTNSTPDIQIRYENIKIESLASPDECETD